MAIYQTNIFICEVCGNVESITAEETLFNDPVINPPNKNWNYNHEGKLACPDCPKNK